MHGVLKEENPVDFWTAATAVFAYFRAKKKGCRPSDQHLKSFQLTGVVFPACQSSLVMP